jgi:hypothetical protein
MSGKEIIMMNIIESYGSLRPVIFLLICVISFICFLFYFAKRKKPYYGYYWKGFLLISIGYLVLLIGFYLKFPLKELNILRRMSGMIIALIGAVLILVGRRKHNLRRPQI